MTKLIISSVLCGRVYLGMVLNPTLGCREISLLCSRTRVWALGLIETDKVGTCQGVVPDGVVGGLVRH